MYIYIYIFQIFLSFPFFDQICFNTLWYCLFSFSFFFVHDFDGQNCGICSRFSFPLLPFVPPSNYIYIYIYMPWMKSWKARVPVELLLLLLLLTEMHRCTQC
ncbi:hypothetical protein, unlikely [Trypanosoma brucei gambiense DAL972]|uniref:Uncharacterized protein n=1 Tax=Trypanosoma brucei gambiense (strain MHOM/CI/86/DAL972) TaxID=679716 RepID=D0A1Y7_TRYB9|nr:hypothetical protein, unlikely [Trypanosoma brucei gambiense DAL972]CBH15280.1 hypothetical protein, unlikely [Trypanosoma brucei gambiense DAL972]|eukprot:XP_011777545.1 hypothetical protein, unlikely [Trypanosoma brucei gambiense DAL972]